MLDLMRKHARNWLMKVLLGIIIIVFVFYFGSLRADREADILATLDGKAITYNDFQREYDKMIDIYRNNFGPNLNEDLLKALKVKEQALDNLIKQAIFLEEAKKLKIQVSDEELRNAIISYPAFQSNGAFNQKVYEGTLRQNRMSPETFEELQRNMLVTQKVQDLIANGVQVSNQEVFDVYRLQTEKINVRFLKLSAKDYRGEVKPTRSALENHYRDHNKELRIPEQVQVKYLSFPAADFLAEVKVSDDDISEYYERNKNRLAKTNDKIPSLAALRSEIGAYLRQTAAMQLASQKAKNAHDTIYQQENFDAYAAGLGKKIHQSPLFSANNIPPELRTIPDFAQIAFSLQKNEISKILSNDRGYYLFQIVTRKPSYIPDLKEAEKEVTESYISKETKLLCQKDAESLMSRLKKGETLEKIAQEKRLRVEETGFVLPGPTVPQLGTSPQVTDTLAQLSASRPYPDKVLSIGDNCFILRFKEKGKLDDADYQKKKEELKKMYTELKKGEILSVWIDGLKNSLVKEGRLKIKKEIKDT